MKGDHYDPRARGAARRARPATAHRQGALASSRDSAAPTTAASISPRPAVDLAATGWSRCRPALDGADPRDGARSRRLDWKRTLPGVVMPGPAENTNEYIGIEMSEIAPRDSARPSTSPRRRSGEQAIGVPSAALERAPTREQAAARDRRAVARGPTPTPAERAPGPIREEKSPRSPRTPTPVTPMPSPAAPRVGVATDVRRTPIPPAMSRRRPAPSPDAAAARRGTPADAPESIGQRRRRRWIRTRSRR